MIGDLAAAVAADLRARKYPHRVAYGPERTPRDGFDHTIVFERDREAGDAIVAPRGANGRNPEVPFNRDVAGRVTVYARSSKPGATVLDHEAECDCVCDGVITAMYRILKARRLPLEITESRMLRREDLRADTGEGDDRSGPRSADWPGCAARIRFSVGTVVRDVTYTGAAGPTATLQDVAIPVVTADGYDDLDPGHIPWLASGRGALAGIAGGGNAAAAVTASGGGALAPIAGAGAGAVGGVASGGGALAPIAGAGAGDVAYNPVRDGISAWLRNDTEGDIVSVDDVINAITATTVAGRRPTGETDLSMTFDADALLLPAVAGNNGLVKLGLAFWLELDDLTVQHYLFRYGPGTVNDPAAGDSLLIRANSAEAIDVRIYNDGTGTLARSATTASGVVGVAKVFVTVEIDLAAAEADKVVTTIDLVDMPLIHGNAVGTPGAFPASMQGAPGDIIIGNRRSNLSTLPLKGRYSRGIFWTVTKSAGAVRGLWSAEQRANIMGVEPPT